MTKIVHEKLVEDIDAAIADGLTGAFRFGMMATKDSHLVYNLRNGRELRAKTLKKVQAALDILRLQELKRQAEAWNDFSSWHSSRHPDRSDYFSLAEEYVQDRECGTWPAINGETQ